MRSRYADRSAYFGNSIELSDKRHYIRHVFGDVANRARRFFPAAADVENSLHRAFTGDCFSHRCGPSVCVLSCMTELEIALGHESVP